MSEENKTEALAVREQYSASIYDRMGDPMKAALEMGRMFAASGLMGITSPEQGAIMAMTCMIERISPIEFIRTYDIIKNKLSKKSAAMQAEFQRGGGRIKWLKYTDDECRGLFSHPELCREPIELSITMAEAQERGLTANAVYKKFPRQMLKARLVAEAIRLINPGINAGVYSEAETDVEAYGEPEVHDMGEARVVDERKEPASPSSTRAEKVIKAFSLLGVTQEQLERFAGNGTESGVLQASEWTDATYKAFTGARDEISKRHPEDRAAIVADIFG